MLLQLLNRDVRVLVQMRTTSIIFNQFLYTNRPMVLMRYVYNTSTKFMCYCLRIITRMFTKLNLTMEFSFHLQPESLFSDVGGTLGLYIGFSVITAIEFFVLFYEICVHCGRKSKPSQPARPVGLPGQRYNGLHNMPTR